MNHKRACIGLSRLCDKRNEKVRAVGTVQEDVPALKLDRRRRRFRDLPLIGPNRLPSEYLRAA